MKITLCLIFVLNFSCIAQNKAYRVFSKLEYSSVNLYYFNCDSNSKLIENNLLCDTSLINSKGKWAYTVSNIKYDLLSLDIENLLKVIRLYNVDIMTSDPVACYTPRMGIVFFRDKLPIGHIDVCLECNKIMMEIFDKNKKINFRESPVSIGSKTTQFFKSLCLKYKLKGCKT